MIAWQLIVAAAAITAVAVGAASWLVGWPVRMLLGSAAGSFGLVIAWRGATVPVITGGAAALLANVAIL